MCDEITFGFFLTIDTTQNWHNAALDITREHNKDLGAVAEALEDFFYDAVIQEHDDPNKLYSNILLMGFNAIDWRDIASRYIETANER